MLEQLWCFLGSWKNVIWELLTAAGKGMWVVRSTYATTPRAPYPPQPWFVDGRGSGALKMVFHAYSTHQQSNRIPTGSNSPWLVMLVKMSFAAFVPGHSHGPS